MKSIFWIFDYVKRRKWLFILSLFLLISESVISIIITGLQKWLIDDILSYGYYSRLPFLITMFILAFLGYAILFTITPYVVQKNNVLLAKDLQTSLLIFLQKIPFSSFRNKKTTEYVQYMTYDLVIIADTISNYIPRGLQQIITAIILTCIVGYISPILLSIIFLVSVCYYIIIKLMGPRSNKIAIDVQKYKSDLTVKMEESISSTREILAYHRKDWEISNFNQLFEKYLTTVIKEGKLQNKISFISEPLKWGAQLTVLGYGAYLVIIGKTSLGLFIVMYQFTSQLISSYYAVFDFCMNLHKRKAHFDRIKEVCEQEIQEQGSISIYGNITSFKINNVSFTYPDTHTKVLNRLSIDFPIGKKIAIVGESGSGKSTISHLIMRLYNPSDGNIFVNDQDIKQIKKEEWLQRIGIIPQEPYLFPGSIRENLLFGIEDLSDKQLIQACRIAQIYEFIIQLPEKFDTIIGERGLSLSGGQRQRIAIVRALLKSPEILILDEATSALDTKTESLFQSDLDKFRRGCTTIIIAHRLSTIENADIIFVINDGNIIERGTHSELLQNNNLYEKLFNAQVLGV
ncbi:TPA: ABC transporter ATP-binding protein [Bacillus cereus]|nr:ABC transporter ATP-binding protein [Bacillus cereus]